MKAEVLNAHTRMLAGLVLGGWLFLSAGARADMLYYFPFQDAEGNTAMTNFGLLGGTFSEAVNGYYTNNTPSRVGRQYAWHVPVNNAHVHLTGSNEILTMETAGDELSILAWIYLTGEQTVQGIVNRITGQVTDGWTFCLRDGRKLTYVVGTGSSGIQRQSSSQIPLEEWTHVAMTWIAGGGNDALKFYINGKAVSHGGSVNLGDAVCSRENENVVIQIGRRANQNAWHLLGSIDEVRLYDEVLTQEQIQEIAFPPLGTVIMIR